jgi:hypothetical protein
MIELTNSLGPLQEAFNKSPGAYKFIALLSPT